MTEEQIKQNAEAYAEMYREPFDKDKEYTTTEMVIAEQAYIAGAHSRDEEIKELEARIYALEKTITVNKYFEEAKLNQLRNPWISVEDRLPDDNQVVLAHHEIIIDGGGEHEEDENVTIQRYVGKWITDRMEQQRMGKWLFDIKDRVTHWMPIPELKGGKG